MKKTLVFALIFFVACGPTEEEIQAQVDLAVENALSEYTESNEETSQNNLSQSEMYVEESTTTSSLAISEGPATTIKAITNRISENLELKNGSIYDINWPYLVSIEVSKKNEERDFFGTEYFFDIEVKNIVNVHFLFNSKSKFEQCRIRLDNINRKTTSGTFRTSVNNFCWTEQDLSEEEYKKLEIVEIILNFGQDAITLYPSGSFKAFDSDKEYCCHKYNFEQTILLFSEFFLEKIETTG